MSTPQDKILNAHSKSEAALAPAPLRASTSLTPAPLRASTFLTPAPLRASTSLTPAPLRASTSLTPAPLRASTSLTPAPLRASASLTPAPLRASGSLESKGKSETRKAEKHKEGALLTRDPQDVEAIRRALCLSQGTCSPVHLNNKIGLIFAHANPKLRAHPFKHILTAEQLSIFATNDRKKISEMLSGKGFDLDSPMSFFLCEKDAVRVTHILYNNKALGIPKTELLMENGNDTVRMAINFKVSDSTPAELRMIEFGVVDNNTLALQKRSLQDCIVTLIIDKSDDLFIQTCYPRTKNESDKFVLETSAQCKKIVQHKEKSRGNVATHQNYVQENFQFQIEKIKLCGITTKDNYFYVASQLNRVSFFATDVFQFSEFVDLGHPTAMLLKGYSDGEQRVQADKIVRHEDHCPADSKRKHEKVMQTTDLCSETTSLRTEKTSTNKLDLKIHAEFNRSVKMALRGSAEDHAAKMEHLKTLLASLKKLTEENEIAQILSSPKCKETYDSFLLLMSSQLESGKFDLTKLQTCAKLVNSNLLQALDAYAALRKTEIKTKEEDKKTYSDNIEKLIANKDVRLYTEFEAIWSHVAAVNDGVPVYKNTAQGQKSAPTKKIDEQVTYLKKRSLPVTFDSLKLAVLKRIAGKYVDEDISQKIASANAPIVSVSTALRDISAVIDGRVKILEGAATTINSVDSMQQDIKNLQDLLKVSSQIRVADPQPDLKALVEMKEHLHRLSTEFRKYFHQWAANKDAIPSLSLSQAAGVGLNIKRNENIINNITTQLNQAIGNLRRILPKGNNPLSHAIIAECERISSEINAIKKKLKACNTVDFDSCSEVMRIAEAFYNNEKICKFFALDDSALKPEDKKNKDDVLQAIKNSHKMYKAMKAQHVEMTVCSSYQRFKMAPASSTAYSPVGSLVANLGFDQQSFGFFVALQQLDADIRHLEQHCPKEEPGKPEKYKLDMMHYQQKILPLYKRSCELLSSLQGQIQSLMHKRIADQEALSMSIRTLQSHDNAVPLTLEAMSTLLIKCSA